MEKLLSLSAELFEARKALVLPNTDLEDIEPLGKRKRPEDSAEDYLTSATEDSLRLVEA